MSTMTHRQGTGLQDRQGTGLQDRQDTGLLDRQDTGLQASVGSPSAAPRERMVSGPLALVFLAEFFALTSFYLLLSVTPLYAARAGAGTSGAGLVTGALLAGTVAAELAASKLMNRFAYRTLVGAGLVLMGIPALALLAGGPLVVIAAISVVRGFGFGLATVLLGALTAMLLPPQRRGEGLGLYGVVASLPGVLALPSGVWLAGHVGYAVVVVLTAATALGPLVAFRWLPGTANPRAASARPDADLPLGLLAGLRQPGELRLALVFAATTVAAGVVTSFLPLATGSAGNVAAIGLFAQALTATIVRWGEGRYGDRHGHARLLVPGLMIASIGMIAMIWLASPAVVIAGMSLFGAGFGIIQNATVALMMDRMPASGLGTASALWNLAYDAGFGAGPVAFGLFVGHTGYPVAFALTGLLTLAALPTAWREHVAARGHGSARRHSR
jgi:MFS family permease